jgi:hypothetical protein
MTWVVDAAVVAAGLFLGRLITRTLRRRGAPQARLPPLETGGEGVADDDSLAGFACGLGDVVVRRFEGDEAWLAGALVLMEERPVAVLFIAPDREGGRAVLARAGSDRTLIWLTPLPTGVGAPSADPPPTVEHAGVRFQRTRRLPVRVERLGSGAPEVGGRVVMGEYAAPGAERLVVIASTGISIAWRGVSLSEDQYDVLPGGKATLEV